MEFRLKLLTVALGLLGVFLWIVLFGLGLLVDSLPFRIALQGSFNWSNFFLSILTYTPTNIIVLCLFAAFSGGCASKLIALGVEKNARERNIPQSKELTDSELYMNENPFGSMLRGLTVYFIFLTGSFLASSDPFNLPNPLQYAKSAGTVSLLSFVVGYDPTVFRSLLNLTAKLKPKE